MIHESKVASSKNVVGFLKGQHKQIERLFDKVIAAHGQDRMASFDELKTLMSAHEAAEEAIVHPTAEGVIRGGEAEVAARVKEEKEAKAALVALAKLDVDSGEFETRIRKLQAAVLVHARSEETEELDKMAAKLDETQLRTMTKQVEQVEAKASKA